MGVFTVLSKVMWLIDRWLSIVSNACAVNVVQTASPSRSFEVPNCVSCYAEFNHSKSRAPTQLTIEGIVLPGVDSDEVSDISLSWKEICMWNIPWAWCVLRTLHKVSPPPVPPGLFRSRCVCWTRPDVATACHCVSGAGGYWGWQHSHDSDTLNKIVQESEMNCSRNQKRVRIHWEAG